MDNNFSIDYELIFERRKSITLNLDRSIIKVKAPFNTQKRYIEDLVKNFYKKNYNSILKAARLISGNEVLIFGTFTDLSSLGLSATEYNIIIKYFYKNFKDDFLIYLKDFAAQHHFKYQKVIFKKLKRRWASCDSKGQLVFNNLIFMLPKHLIEYLIVHELCHLRQFNHSKLFWNQVEMLLPNYRQLRAELKSYDFLTDLYK